MTVCSTCSCDFDIEAEGGIEGEFGIIPVAFCPACYACCYDMVQPHCEHCDEDN